MKRTYTFAVPAMLLLATAAYGQVTLNSVRIGAKDTAAAAKFYQAAFGMQEVNRIEAPVDRRSSSISVPRSTPLRPTRANRSSSCIATRTT